MNTVYIFSQKKNRLFLTFKKDRTLQSFLKPALLPDVKKTFSKKKSGFHVFLRVKLGLIVNDR